MSGQSESATTAAARAAGLVRTGCPLRRGPPVVLITDFWQPEVIEVERQAVQAVIKTSDDFIRWCHGGAETQAVADW